jgi:GH25 family lysozyme M1 (1,4-beta-N-acetylmuramidase)
MWIYNSYPVWLAHYVDHTNYDGNYILWQMCNDGVIDGINGAVDIDIYNK